MDACFRVFPGSLRSHLNQVLGFSQVLRATNFSASSHNRPHDVHKLSTILCTFSRVHVRHYASSDLVFLLFLPSARRIASSTSRGTAVLYSPLAVISRKDDLIHIFGVLLVYSTFLACIFEITSDTKGPLLNRVQKSIAGALEWLRTLLHPTCLRRHLLLARGGRGSDPPLLHAPPANHSYSLVIIGEADRPLFPPARAVDPTTPPPAVGASHRPQYG